MTVEHAQQLVAEVAHPGLANELELLAAISQDFLAAPAVEATLANAVQQIMNYMDTEAASIFLLDEAGGRLRCHACAGPVPILGLTIPADRGIIGRTVSGQTMQIVRDTAADLSFCNAVDDMTGFRTRSILCAPLAVKGKVVGALEIINKRSGDGLFGVADQQLLCALAGMVSLAVHNARMAEQLVEQERIRRELDLAREIQRGLLPPSGRDDDLIHGLNLPALEVSGDFYDFFGLPDGRVAWGLGDVSGKGMNAALLMAKTIALFRCLGKSEQDPARLLARLNDEIAETASHGMFVTMIAGVLDPAAGSLRFANAGHQPPLLRTASGVYLEFDEASPPLGVIAGIEYVEQRLELDAGTFYVFSDGVSEGKIGDGGMLGVGGLKTLLERHHSLNAAARLQAVADVLARPGIRLHDDVTLLAIGR